MNRLFKAFGGVVSASGQFLFIGLVAASAAQYALAQSPGSTFPARLTAQLCPEYRSGRATMKFRYSLPESAEEVEVTPSGQNIDSGNNSGMFTLPLPADRGTEAITVKAYCQGPAGPGKLSNTLSISYCAVLALRDTDHDTLTDEKEDVNCNGVFDAGEPSDFRLADTDGDGTPDNQEIASGTNPLLARSVSQPLILAGSPFDFDGDGDSDPVVWRPSASAFLIRQRNGAAYTLPFAQGDRPFVYNARGANSDVGMISSSDAGLIWKFHGAGFNSSSALVFGKEGDRIILGPWEEPDITNPAVARIEDGLWKFLIYRLDGSTAIAALGADGSIPVVQDYDGDGIFDAAVYNPSSQSLDFISSSTKERITRKVPGTASLFVLRGDVTADGKDDLSLWRDGAFETAGAGEVPLTAPAGAVPLSWFRVAGKIVYTLVDPNGLRVYSSGAGSVPGAVTWGTSGDFQG